MSILEEANCFQRRSLQRVSGLFLFIGTTATFLACTTQLRVVTAPSAIGEMQGVSARTATQPLPGVVYYLPVASYDITVTWLLTKCASAEIAFQVSATIVEKLVADTGSPYVIDYSRADTLLKQTDLQVALYENGTLKSLNGSSGDASGEVLTSTLRAATNVFSRRRVEDSRPLGSSAGPCLEHVSGAIAQRERLRQQIATLREQNYNVALKDPLTDADKLEIRKNTASLGLKEDALRRIEALISHTESRTWTPKNLSDFDMIKMSALGLRKFLPEAEVSKRKAEIPDREVKVRFEPDAQSRKIQDVGENPKEHIVYRNPAQAVLRLETAKDAQAVVEKKVGVPQAGERMALPLVNKAFRNTSLSAQFAPNGALTEFKYVSKVQAAALSRAVSEVAGAVEAARSRELRSLEERTAVARAEAELIKAERELAALQAEQNGNEP